jgi:histidinol-phosphate aminotransferase
MSICDLALPSVTELQPYQPGKPIEELQREYGVQDVIKLASNENPLGPSPKVLAIVNEAAKDLTRYPDGNGFALKQALADKLSVAAEQITLGNGSNDVLELLARVFAGPGDEIIYSEHAFAVYPIAAKVVGAMGVMTPAKDYGHDLIAMQQAITARTKLVFIANPNNPTGTYLPAEDIKNFLDCVPERVIVVLDEAYIEYLKADEDAISWLVDYDNLVITRTFSKAYGLAGLRIGYAISHPEVADLLNRLRQPFNANSLAQAAAIAALNDHDYLQRSREMNAAGMAQLITGFDEMGLSYIPSQGNFITVHVHVNAAEVYDDLLYEGVIVRPIANYGLPQHLRVSIGLPEENARFLTALAKVLGSSS